MTSDPDRSNVRADKEPSADPSLRKKQMLVGVLVVGLVVALLTQPEAEDTESVPGVVGASLQSNPSPTTRPAAAAAPSEPSKAAGGTLAPDLSQVRELPRFDIDAIVGLELLAPEPNPLAKSIAPAVGEVQAVYGTSKGGRTALVGESIVRGGQPLPGGVTVLHVSDEGIEVGRN